MTGDVDRDRPAAGPLLLAVGVSVLAGLVSFASPCVVPLVPGYLSYLAAVVGVEEQPSRATVGVAVRTARLRVAGAALLFVAGFTAVFVLGTVAVLGMTTTLITNQLLLQRIGGVRHDRDGPGVRRASSRCCSARPGSRRVSSPRSAARHCSARCSRSAGRRASARR